jgi:hypothetical protein
MPAKAGIQESPLKPLDSGFRRNDEMGEDVAVQGSPNPIKGNKPKQN